MNNANVELSNQLHHDCNYHRYHPQHQQDDLLGSDMDDQHHGPRQYDDDGADQNTNMTVTSAAIWMGVRPSSISRFESAPDLSNILILNNILIIIIIVIIIIVIMIVIIMAIIMHDHETHLEHCSPLASSILEAICNGASPILPPLI